MNGAAPRIVVVFFVSTLQDNFATRKITYPPNMLLYQIEALASGTLKAHIKYNGSLEYPIAYFLVRSLIYTSLLVFLNQYIRLYKALSC